METPVRKGFETNIYTPGWESASFANSPHPISVSGQTAGSPFSHPKSPLGQESCANGYTPGWENPSIAHSPHIRPITSASPASSPTAASPNGSTLRPARSSLSTVSGVQSSQNGSNEPSSDYLPFDEEFQRLISEISDERILKEESSFRSLSRLSRDFRFAAMTYGKVIIAEKHLPESEKTIKPCGDLPGLAGGEKYLAGGILFRFAVDRHRLYGSDELAGKEAAHQLRGLTEVVSAGVEGLHFPLMALIDYRGYRLLAVSRLPIHGTDTLVLGSQDAGTNILGGTDVARNRVAILAKALNLKEHRIMDQTGNVVSLHGPCDLEVHLAEDRLYAVDFARLFPPEPPSLFAPAAGSEPRRLISFETDPTNIDEENDDTTRCRAPQLVRLLRPELVRTNDTPLSSDAFSHFGALDRDVHDREVARAGKRLAEQCIPAAAAALSLIEVVDVTQMARDTLRWTNEEEISFVGMSIGGGGETGGLGRDWMAGLNANGRQIVSTLHKNGVNMRHIGRVYPLMSVNKWQWQKQLLCEAVARCVKVRLRAAMRQTMRRVRTAVLTPFLSAVTDQLNLTLGCPPCTRPSSKSCSCDAACKCLCSCPSARSSPTNSVADGVSTVAGVESMESMTSKKARWWCHTLPEMLRDRFGFNNIRELLLLSAKRDAHSASRCSCCGCGFSRYLSRPLAFAKVSDSCGLVLSPPLSLGLLESLSRNSVSRPQKSVPSSSSSVASSPHTRVTSPPPLSQQRASPYSSNTSSPVSGVGGLNATNSEPSLFDLPEPFDEGSIVDVLGSIKVLPLLDYATGTALLIKARNMKNSGAHQEAKRLARAAKESFDTGLAQCPTDPRLLSNLAFLLEDVFGDAEQALKLYEESVIKNPMHARSHYYLALCLWRRFQKQNKSFQNHGLMDRVRHHFTRALDISPRNANILKDFARFKHQWEKDFQGAIELLKRALEVEPTHLRAHEALANLYEAKNDHESAGQIWRSLSLVKCTVAESIQARGFLIRNLIRLKQLDEAESLLKGLLEDIQNYKMHAKGHSDRPNASWAIKCTRVLVEVAEQYAAMRRTCSPIVHEFFNMCSQIFTWFGTPPPSSERKLEKSIEKEYSEMRRGHAFVLKKHGRHTSNCDCEELDHVGMSQDLFDNAVAVDPSCAWERKAFTNYIEGLDNDQAEVMVKDNGSILSGGTDPISNNRASESGSNNNKVRASAFSEVVKNGGGNTGTGLSRVPSIGKRKEPPYVLRNAGGAPLSKNNNQNNNNAMKQG